MDSKKPFECNINSEVSEKFTIALMLNKEKADDVIEKIMIQYISDSFAKASKSFNPQETRKNNVVIGYDDNYGKANRKIPMWVRKPQQNNHRIIKAFFELEEEFGTVTVEALAERCSNATEYPNTFSNDFRGNFAQMKTDASNSHGKVFIVNNDIIEIWDEIEEILFENKHFFTSRFEGGFGMAKITNEMVETAYKYSKKVYSGELTRSEGKIEIDRVSGMNIGSAQDYITDFLDMMDGKEYHRTMNNYGTEYFLKNIKKDFGDKAFLLALGATEKHIKYYTSLRGTQLPTIQNIVRKLRESM